MQFDLDALVADVNPKPKMNLEYFYDNGEYSDGDSENVIVKILAENDAEKYSKAITENYSWATFCHLNAVRKNILNWYPFKNDASLLEIGCGCGSITNMLCEKVGHVTSVDLSKRRATATQIRCRDKENLDLIVGNLNDIEFKEKFDYITLIGVFEYQGVYTDSENPYLDFLRKMKTLLKPDGKLLIAIENQFGLKYWCGAGEDHTQVPFDGMNNYRYTNMGVRTFSKETLRELAKEAGLVNTYFYYPLPDYKLPTVVYSEGYLPKPGDHLKMEPYYSVDSKTIIADEMALYDEVVKNNCLEFFANSFLLECSESGEVGEVVFALLDSERQDEYKIGTKITADGHVVKFPLKPDEGKPHMLECTKNEQRLMEHGIHVLPSTEVDGTLVTDFVDAIDLEEYLAHCYRTETKEEIIGVWDCLIDEILKSSEEVDPVTNVLYSLGLEIPVDIEKFGRIQKIGYLDMIPRNAFLVDGEIVWFDQEWIFENVPVKLILFRMIISFYMRHQEANVVLSMEELARYYGVTEAWDEFLLFEQLFQKIVVDEDYVHQHEMVRAIQSPNVYENLKRMINSN